MRISDWSSGRGLFRSETADLRDVLPRLAVPSLWIAGRRDRLVDPRAMRAAADTAPDSTFAHVEQGGHAPFLTPADEFAALSDGLLRELPCAPCYIAARCGERTDRTRVL